VTLKDQLLCKSYSLTAYLLMVRVSTIHDEPLFHFKQIRAYANEATCVVKASTRVGHSTDQPANIAVQNHIRIKRLRHVIEVVDNVVNRSAGSSTFRATARMLCS
jgi:hypothetical protein